MTDPYQISLGVLQKLFCFASATGSLMIISQVSRNRLNRKKSQQRLILGISVVDCITSIVWFFTNLFVPPDSGVLWAIGNEQTCEAQGFIVQFSIAGILYMCCLQLQYLLTIKYGWKEKAVRRIEPYMHCIPILYGMCTATTALVKDLYNPANWDCWIAPLPGNCTSSYDIATGGSDLEMTDCVRGDNARFYRWGFFFGPLWASIVFCIAVMIALVRFVRQTERKSLEWTQGTGDESHKMRAIMEMKYTSQVFTQCIMYAGAFLVVWTFPTITRLIQLFGYDAPRILVVLAGCFIASQGFFNACTYFRPRYLACEKEGVLPKVLALMRSTLFFCFYDEDCTKDSKDYVPSLKHDDDYIVKLNGGQDSPINENEEGKLEE